MNEAIKWLFQRTPDGATYLQVIILMPMLCVLIYGFCYAVTDMWSMWNDIKEEEDNNGETDN